MHFMPTARLGLTTIEFVKETMTTDLVQFSENLASFSSSWQVTNEHEYWALATT